MRVALVIAGPYPALRGSQVLVRQLASGLAGRGHVVEMVTYGTRLRDRPGLHPARIALDVALTVRLWRVVRRQAIDVIHAHNYEAAIAGLLVSRLTGRPVVYHGHSALAEELPTYARGRIARRLLGRVGRILDAQVPRRADFCVAVTEELGALLRHAGVTPDDVACIPPAGAPDEMAPLGVRPTDGAEVCYAGNLDGYQNLDFLLRVFAGVRAQVSRARLVVVTHEGRSGWNVPDGVDVVRVASYDEVRQRLEAADVAVCPRTEHSGFPMKLLNYMAAGKAIVASAGSAKGLADHVNGRVVRDGDAHAFAAAVVDLLRDAGQRERLGAAARRCVEDPDAWNRVLDRMEGIYRRVVARGEARMMPLAVTE